MNAEKRKQSGFTLIELMIVFLVIIVLAGMVMRLMGMAGKHNAKAETQRKLEAVAQAIEAFRAEYGQYPPVSYYPGLGQPFEYEYPTENMMGNSVKQLLLSANKGDKNSWSCDTTEIEDEGTAIVGRAFTFGLMSYLFPRYKGHAESAPEEFIGGGEGDDFDKKDSILQWTKYNSRNDFTEIGEIESNIASSRKIVPFLSGKMDINGKVTDYGIVWHHQTGLRTDKKGSSEIYYNMELTIHDGWGRTLHYKSRPPYDSYKLWSSGPDGKSGNDDDVIVGQS